jgi:hypothetical protein
MKGKEIPTYLFYALGEIFLVVLGILIAVSINNWNEERKSDLELKNIYSVVKADLENDLKEIEEINNYYSNIKGVFRKIMGDSLTQSEYTRFAPASYIILGYPEISFDKRGFNLLSAFKTNSETIQDTLIAEIIEFYTERLLEIEVDDTFRAKDFENNFLYWKNNFDWWSGYLNQTDFKGFAAYAVTADYRNRVTTNYFLTYQVFLPELVLFGEMAEKIIIDIDKQLNLSE